MTSDDPRPLYERDPAAWDAYLAEGNASQPRKRVSADALIRDRLGRVLIVDPKYKPDWDLPGGMAEENEPPHEAVRRELKEEVGLGIQPARLLVVDWVSPHGPWDDLIAFIFDGGEIDDEAIRGLRPVDEELASLEFVTAAEAQRRLRPYVWRRMSAAIAALDGPAVYLRDGQQV